MPCVESYAHACLASLAQPVSAVRRRCSPPPRPGLAPQRRGRGCAPAQAPPCRWSTRSSRTPGSAQRGARRELQGEGTRRRLAAWARAARPRARTQQSSGPGSCGLAAASPLASARLSAATLARCSSAISSGTPLSRRSTAAAEARVTRRSAARTAAMPARGTAARSCRRVHAPLRSPEGRARRHAPGPRASAQRHRTPPRLRGGSGGNTGVPRQRPRTGLRLAVCLLAWQSSGRVFRSVAALC